MKASDAELKDQLSWSVVSVLSRIWVGAAGLMASMESSWVVVERSPVVMPVAATDWMATWTVLVRSRSETVRVPAVATVESVSVRALLAWSLAPMVMVGASLLPVIVTMTVEASVVASPEVAPALSVTLTV